MEEKTTKESIEESIQGLEKVDKILIKELKILSNEVRKVKELEYIKILDRPWKFMWLSLVKGLMIGFGTVLGASVLVAVFVYIMAQISFVPIIGEFIEDLFEELNVTESLAEKAMNNDQVTSGYTRTKEQLNN